MSKPTISEEKLEFASSDITDAESGQSNKVETSAAKKTNGWAWKEKPPFNWFNYWMNIVYLYIKYIVQEALEGTFTFTGVKTFTETGTSPKSIILDNGDLTVEGELVVEENINSGGSFDSEGNINSNSLYTQNDITIHSQKDKFYDTGVIDDMEFERKNVITTYAIDEIIAYCGDGIIIFTKNSDNKLYKKSITDVDNETALTTYAIYDFAYCGDGIIIFTKSSDNKLYKKSITDVDNETNITTFTASKPRYIGDGLIVYIKASDSKVYRKSITDVDNVTNITTYTVGGYLLYVGNISSGVSRYILFAKQSDSKLYIKDALVLDTETLLFDGVVDALACYIGNGKFIFKTSSIWYIKSIWQIDSVDTGDKIGSIDAWGNTIPEYVGNGYIVYEGYPGFGFIALKSIKDFS